MDQPMTVLPSSWSPTFALLAGHGAVVGFPSLDGLTEREIGDAAMAQGYILTFQEAPHPLTGTPHTWMRVSYAAPKSSMPDGSGTAPQ